MKACWCRFVLSLLVIVFAWWVVSWGKIALTIIGALLAILSLIGTCCCDAKRKAETPGEGEG